MRPPRYVVLSFPQFQFLDCRHCLSVAQVGGKDAEIVNNAVEINLAAGATIEVEIRAMYAHTQIPLPAQ